MTTMPAAAPGPIRRRSVVPALPFGLDGRRLVAATLIAAVADAAFAFVAYVLIASRYNFETLLQYIATGLLGHDAYRTGWTGVATAALGLLAHLGLAATFTGVFALTVGRLVRVAAVAVLVGLAYGVGVWVLMAQAVLPALGVAHEPVGGGYWWAFLIDHALLVGLPIAWLTYRHDA